MLIKLENEDFEKVKECFRLYKKYPKSILNEKQQLLLEENKDIYFNGEINLKLFQNLSKIQLKLEEQDIFMRSKLFYDKIMHDKGFHSLKNKQKVLETLNLLQSKNIDISKCFSSQNTQELEENLKEIYLKITLN